MDLLSTLDSKDYRKKDGRLSRKRNSLSNDKIETKTNFNSYKISAVLPRKNKARASERK